MTRMIWTLNSFKTVIELIRFELIQAVAQRRILAVISVLSRHRRPFLELALVQ